MSPKAPRGGPRKGAGRPPEPRLSPEATRTFLDTLAAGSTLAELARRLGLTRQAVDKARARGLSVRKSEEWAAKL